VVDAALDRTVGVVAVESLVEVDPVFEVDPEVDTVAVERFCASDPLGAGAAAMRRVAPAAVPVAAPSSVVP
jgi:hypothetical protein